MPYSVMLWLVDPGHDDGERSDDQANATPGGTGFTAPPPATCLSYGMFDSELDTEEALTMLSEALRQNAPLRVTRGSRTFVIPAARVHYIVCDEVTRPKDG